MCNEVPPRHYKWGRETVNWIQATVWTAPESEHYMRNVGGPDSDFCWDYGGPYPAECVESGQSQVRSAYHNSYNTPHLTLHKKL